MNIGFFFCVVISIFKDPVSGLDDLSITPHSLLAEVGESVTVQCHANNLQHSPKSIYWIASSKLADNFYQTRTNITTTSFHISKLRHSDAGIYQCVLITIDDKAIYSNLNLYVIRKLRDLNPICGTTRFRCQKTDRCIFLRYRCDGYKDCTDGSDEDNCPVTCSNKFRCNNGRCIDTSFLCDHSDNCGDQSDEIHQDCMDIHRVPDGVTLMSTVTPGISDADHFNWLKTTVYIVIGCTVALVIFISFIVIIVFRLKMKRLRARRLARAMERHRRHQSGSQNGRPSEHEAFLPVSTNSHYGNIIVNVNNGVQYVPNSEFGGLMEAPPSYAEVVGVESEHRESPPPAYSTIDRHPKSITETAPNTSRLDVTSQNAMQTHQPSTSAQATIAENRGACSTIPEEPGACANIFQNVEGAVGPVPGSQAINSNNESAINTDNRAQTSNPSFSSLPRYSAAMALSPPSNSSSQSNQPNHELVTSPRSTAANNDGATSNIFMHVEGAARNFNRPSTSGEITPNTRSAELQTQTSISSQPLETADNESTNQNADIITAGSGHLAVLGGKIYLRSESSGSTSAPSPPIKGHLEVQGGQIVLKPERRGPTPVAEAPRSHDSSEEGSLGRGALEVREGRILLR